MTAAAEHQAVSLVSEAAACQDRRIERLEVAIAHPVEKDRGPSGVAIDHRVALHAQPQIGVIAERAAERTPGSARSFASISR